MKVLITLIGIMVVLGLAGCGAGDPKYGGNAAGSEANSGKTYSTDDATAAQPQRGAAEPGDAAGK